MIYQRLLRSDFDRLPAALNAFHSTPGGGRATGRIAVRRKSPLLAWLARFPAEGDDIPAQLEVVTGAGREVWTRRFGGAVYNSIQECDGDLLMEQAGPIRLYFRLSFDGTVLRFETARARLWIIPLPVRVDAWERGDGSSWQFQVTVARVGTYSGSMVPLP